SFDMNGNLIVTSQGTYVNFGGSNTVKYFEVAADNTLLVATSGLAGGGMLWEVGASKDAHGVPSCSTTSGSPTSVDLADALDSAPVVANGVTLPPTSITVTADFSPAHPSQTFNFGFHRLMVTYKQVLRSFTQSFTAVRSRPEDISFDGNAFPTETHPVHINPLGGFTVQYVTRD